MPRKFLSQIADYYTDPDKIGNLGNLTFIFPNKRSALFLKRYIQQRVPGNSVLMPRFSTFKRFVSKVTGRGEPSRFEALFMLYNAYSETLLKAGQAEHANDFDRFIFWGDMILSDFDTIDSSLADARRLYANLRAVHEISADYLTDEQKEVIERIWGVNNLSVHIDRFWKHFNPSDDGDSEATRKFLSLWDILYDIYEAFRKKLDDAGMATGGMLMRDALDMLRSGKGVSHVRGRFVFVGLSELTTAELAIMDTLHRQGRADFFWDLQGAFFSNSAGALSDANNAVRLISRLNSQYPSPPDFRPDEINDVPVMDIVGLPSSVGQAKVAAGVIRQWLGGDKNTPANAIETAIVVPEPSQLMPLMLGMPDDLCALNVTMGLPCSSTTFATLFSAVIQMQRRSRRGRGGKTTFFFQDVLEVLMHPHVRVIAGDIADKLRHLIIDKRIFNVEAEMLVAECPGLQFIFMPVADTDSLDESYSYVAALLDGLEQGVSAKASAGSRFEADILKSLRGEVDRLRDLMVRYHIRMQETTFLALFESILRSKVLNVEGTPLEGVQVMGVLETRAIDFDNIIFLAMNERTFPRRDYVKTMIPNNLRRGYGLPPIEWSEQFYAFNFFRSLSHASKAVMFYDTRPPGRGTGEMSRYLTRLQYLFPDKVKVHKIELSSLENEKRHISVVKDDIVMEQLRRYLTPGGPNLSASTLKTFKNCPLAFYLKVVCGLGEDDTPVEYLDPAKQGDIFHRSAKSLYDKYKNGMMDKAVLTAMADDPELSVFVTKEVARAMGLDPATASESDLSFEGLLLRNEIAVQLRSMLLVEAEEYCAAGGFKYLSGEFDVKDKQWEVSPGLKVNFRMQIDRIDQIDGSTLRFIDYKTGTDDTVLASVTGLFNGTSEKDAIFQLLIYAEAFHDLVDPKWKVLPVIHKIRDISKNGKIGNISFNRKPMEPFPALSDQFRPLLNELVGNIFDPEKPFVQTDKENNCTFCAFLDICGRTPKEFN